MSIPEVEQELDAGIYFKPSIKIDLAKCTTIENIIGIFGYAADDRIERRDLVQIYRRVETEMEAEIKHRAHTGKYSAAKEMRGTLTKLRSKFDEMLGHGEVVMRQDQVIAFSKAKDRHLKAITDRHHEQELNLRETLTELDDNLELTQRIERENLEKRIKRIKRPRVKYSKRVIELVRAENELIRLCQYDDAEKVRLMLDKIVPVERKRFYKEFDDNINLMRKHLADRQAMDRIRHEESTKGIEWKDIRRRDKEYKIETYRIKHHSHDMQHAHEMESKLRPEMSVKPSALWIKRPGYTNTSSSMRGQQLQDMVNGKKKGQQVFAETLTDRHTFEEGALQDTITYASGNMTYY